MRSCKAVVAVMLSAVLSIPCAPAAWAADAGPSASASAAKPSRQTPAPASVPEASSAPAPSSDASREDAFAVSAANGWVKSGNTYAYHVNGRPLKGWLVTAETPFGTRGGLERYWLDKSSGTLKPGLVNTGDGWSFVKSNGAVARGKYRDPKTGYFYLADNDGKLMGSGWLVTAAFDGGLQRYYIDPSLHAAVPGVSDAGGWRHFTRPDTGYVVRGWYFASPTSFYRATEDGVLMGVDISGDAHLNSIVACVISSRGNDLRSLFDYVASYRYVTGPINPTGNWSVPFARAMWNDHGGNCYGFAALFCWLARGCGYDARVVVGSVPSRSQGWAPHGWVEIDLNGTTYVCDPDMANALPRHNWFMVTYANAPVQYRK